MKFVSLICSVVALRLNGNPSNPTDDGDLHDPPMNQASEYLYNATFPIEGHKYTIPPSREDDCSMHHDAGCSALSRNWHHIGDQWEQPAPTPGYAQ